MATRIPLIISQGRITLMAVIGCASLRIGKKTIEFVIDTGSPDSYLSEQDVVRFQVPLNRKTAGQVDFGGSRFKTIALPKFNMWLLPENKNQTEPFQTGLNLAALKTSRTAEKHVDVAQTLPSILGTDFLRDQKFSLYVNLQEHLAYLQYEG